MKSSLKINKKRARIRHTSILSQFTISYLLMVLIPIMMGAANYWYNFSESTRQTLYSNMLILKHSMNMMENSLNSIKDFSDTMNGQPYLDKIVNASDPKSKDLLTIQKTVNDLSYFNDSNQYVTAYYLYSNRNKMLVAPHKVFFDIKMYYDYFWGGGDQTYEDWYKKVLENPVNTPRLSSLNRTSGDVADKYILYQLPYCDWTEGVTGQFIFEIDEKQVKKTLDPAFQLGASFMYIADKNGEFLVTMEQEGNSAHLIEDLEVDPLGNSKEVKIDGQKMVISYCKSADYGLDFVIAIPKKVLVKNCMKSLGVTLLGTGVLVFIGILLILASYVYNKRPLANMANELAVSSDDQKTNGSHQPIGNGGLWRLSRSLSVLVQNNNTMEEQIQKQRRHLRRAFLVQLVTGELLDEEKLNENLREYGLEINQTGHFRGVYMGVLSKGESEASDMGKYQDEMVLEVLKSFSDYLVVCFWMDGSHLAMLYMEPENSEYCQHFEDCFKELYYQIKDICGLETVFFVGMESDSLSTVSLSFTEARKLLTSQKDSTEKILFVNDSNLQNQESYQYSAQQEEKLLELVENGDYIELSSRLDILYHQNFIEKHLSSYMRELLFSRMAGTLFCSKWSKELSIQQLNPAELNTVEFFSFMKQQYESLCEKSSKLRKKEQAKTENEIVKYINTHYCESMLSLSALSLQFGITEIYLSTLIKQLVGEKFSVYVEKLRISKANELLKNTKLSVSEIGFQVGYDNASSFGRAYKRITGYSPGQYLNQLK